MISRSAIGPTARRALRRQHCLAARASQRGLAAAASGSYQYQTAEAAGVKIASRDLSGPTTTLALVSKGGTRYQWLPGLAEGLEKFAFKNTEKRSALRITREVELLGGELFTFRRRECLMIAAKFLRGDLPYFVELLGEVAAETNYQDYMYNETVSAQIKQSQKAFLANPADMALNSVHGVAFHRGLGTPLSPSSSVPTSKYLDAKTIEVFSWAAYAKPNIAVVANGADQAELQKWVGEYFADTKPTPPPDFPELKRGQAKYYGGEERIAHASGNAMVIGLPGSSSFTGLFYKPELSVLAALLGGQSAIKWSPGYSLLSKAATSFPGAHIETKNHVYSDAGLLTVTITGNAKDVSGAAFAAVKTIKDVAAGNVSKEDFKKAVATAKFKELELGQNIWAGIELTGTGLLAGGKAYQMDEVAKSVEGVTEAKLKQAAKELLEYRASVSTVGDIFALPYAEELGLNV